MSNDNQPLDGSYEQLRLDITMAIKRASDAGLRPLTIWNVLSEVKGELDATVWGEQP